LPPSSNTTQLIPENISIAERKERLFGTVANKPSSLSATITIKPMSHQSPVSPTDKAFKDLCIASNDQIMNYPSNSNLFSIDSLEAKNATESPLPESKINGAGDATIINNPHKINSMLLYEIIHAEIDDPQLSLKNDNVKIRSCSESTSARSYEIAARNYEQRLSINKTNPESQNGPCVDNDNLDDDVFLEQESITKQQQRKSRSVSPSRKSTSSGERRSSTSTSSSFSSTTSLTRESKKQQSAAYATATASNAMGAMGKAKNVSTGTTLEISSYTSDSLFNSHFLTPMYSDTLFSPSTQLGSLLMKSPLLQPNSPAAYRSNTQQAIYNAYYNSGQSPKSLSSFNFNSITPQQKRHFFQPSTANNNDDSFGSLPNATKPPYRSPTFNSTSPTALVKTNSQGIA